MPECGVILEDRKALLPVLVGGTVLRPVLMVLGADGLLFMVYSCCLAFGCVEDTVMPGIFLPQQSTCSQSSRPSFPRTQKNRKMKKPCNELKMAKRNWNTVEPSKKVKKANTHISPKRAITPPMLIISLMTAFRFVCSLLPNFLRLCLMSTLITRLYITTLKRRMAKIGPRKAPKNTPVFPIKQLQEGNNI